MSAFSQRHYERIADTLSRCRIGDDVIAEFVAMLRADNPNFNPRVFVKAAGKVGASVARMEDHGVVAAWR